MLLRYDTASRVLTCIPSVASEAPALSVSHDEAVSIRLYNNNNSATLASGQAMKIELVQRGKYDDGSVLADVTLTSADLSADEANRYDSALDTFNDAVKALLKINGDNSDDIASVRCQLFIAYRDSSGGDFITCPVPVDLALNNTPFAATQPTPWPMPYGLFRPFIATALTGDLETTLDGIATVNLTADVYGIGVIFNGALNWWQLQTHVSQTIDGVGVVQPSDYDASTNKKVWVILA